LGLGRQVKGLFSCFASIPTPSDQKSDGVGMLYIKVTTQVMLLAN